MKFLVSLIFLASFLAACGKTEGVWDELGTADRNQISIRARAECICSSQADFDDFKAKSELVYSSDKWERQKGWKHELKNGTTVDTTHSIRVWKNDGTDLYLLITRTINSATRVYFLRIPKTTNEAMITALQNQYCDKQVAASTSSSRISVTEEYEVPTGLETKEYKDVYDFDFSYLAYMGSAWKVKRTIITKDADDDQVGATVTLTSTFVALSTSSLPALETVYTAYVGAQFCDITGPTYTVPYAVPETCVTSIPVGWDLSY